MQSKMFSYSYQNCQALFCSYQKKKKCKEFGLLKMARVTREYLIPPIQLSACHSECFIPILSAMALKEHAYDDDSEI